MASFGAAQVSNLQKFSLRKSYFPPIRESFLPRKFPAMRYLAITENRLKVDVCVGNSAAMSKHVPVKAIWF